METTIVLTLILGQAWSIYKMRQRIKNLERILKDNHIEMVFSKAEKDYMEQLKTKEK